MTRQRRRSHVATLRRVAPTQWHWMRVAQRLVGRTVIALTLDDPISGTIMVMFPKMRARRVVGLWLAVTIFRAVTSRSRAVARPPIKRLANAAESLPV